MCCRVSHHEEETIPPRLYDGGQQIPRSENQDYLGVTINNKLSWKPHITKIKNKANNTLGMIGRNLHAAPQQVRNQAHEALVGPTLEYATCAWAPHTKLDIQAVEQFQRAADRYVCGDYRRRSSVTVMINKIEWDTQRRTLRDQPMFYKVYHGQVGISPLPPSMLRTTGQGVSTTDYPGKLLALSTLLCSLHTCVECYTQECRYCSHCESISISSATSDQNTLDTSLPVLALRGTFLSVLITRPDPLCQSALVKRTLYFL